MIYDLKIAIYIWFRKLLGFCYNIMILFDHHMESGMFEQGRLKVKKKYLHVRHSFHTVLWKS
jgi:hypothetical protein